MTVRRTLAVALICVSVVACNQANVAFAGKKNVKSLVTSAAVSHGVPPALAHGIVKVESGYNCRAQNGSHHGLGQVNVRTAKGLGVTGDLKNCEIGLVASMKYLRLALNRAHGDWCGAATLYNRGVYARPSSSAYCRKVLMSARSLS